MTDQGISQDSHDVVERANDLHHQHRAMIAPGGVWVGDLHHRYVLALQAAWPFASATIASLREQVERQKREITTLHKLADQRQGKYCDSQSRASVLEGALRQFVLAYSETEAASGGLDKANVAAKAVLNHSLPMNEPHDASAVISEIAKSGDDRRGVNAGSTSSCDCYPWPDKCPYCGGSACPATSSGSFDVLQTVDPDYADSFERNLPTTDGDTGEKIRMNEFYAEAAAETLPSDALPDRESLIDLIYAIITNPHKKAGVMVQEIQALLSKGGPSETLSPDTELLGSHPEEREGHMDGLIAEADAARADREAIERGVRFYCRGYVHDSHGEDRIYFSGILISGLVDAIVDALSKGGGTTEGSQG